jgi:molybdate transport system substrate-binding protein
MRWAVLVCCVLLGEPQSPRAPVTVSAASSLTDALEEIGKAYAAAGGDSVRFNFGASSMLARQIVAGAPVDVFISADRAQMDVAEKAGAIDKSTRVDLLANRLAVVTPGGQAHSLPDVRALLQPRVRRIALGDPAAVPAGVYAREYLQRIGVWGALQARLVPVGNVRAALAAAANGSVDAAFVYESDAAASNRAELAFVVSGPDAPEIVYPAALVSASKRRDAATRFLAFVRGREASVVFARFKFVPRAER